MQTIRLKIDDRIYDRFISLLKKFDKEIEIIEEDEQYSIVKEQLNDDYILLKDGKDKLFDIDQVNEELEKIIRQYED